MEPRTADAGLEPPGGPTAPQNTPSVALSSRGPSLRVRLACLVAVLVGTVVGTGSFLVARVSERRVEQDVRATVLLAAQGVADALEVQAEDPTPDGLRNDLAAAAERPPVRAITVVGFRGGPASPAWAAGSGAVVRDADVQLAQRAYRTRSEVLGSEDGYLLTAAVPFTRSDGLGGGVAVTGSLQSVEHVRRTGRHTAFAFAVAAVVILTVLVDQLARPLVHGPLQQMLDTIRRAAAGEIGARAVVHRRDEIGAVAAGLNDLLSHSEELRASLQERVNAATAELRARNDDLVASYQRMFALREALARAQQTAAAGQTAANLAHQIGTPLNLISGYVQMMIEEEGEDLAHAREDGDEARSASARRDRLRAVQEQIRKVTEVVRSTLAAVRQAPAMKDPVFPSSILRRIAEVARPRLAASGIDLELRVDDDLPWLMGDAVQLELALLNLVSNSLDAMPGGGTVTMTGTRVGATTRIEVADTGPGISPDLLPRIFEPWVTSKPVGRGTGLGLSITRDALVAHGGSIAVRSEPGRGTTFTIDLPGRVEATAQAES